MSGPDIAERALAPFVQTREQQALVRQLDFGRQAIPDACRVLTEDVADIVVPGPEPIDQVSKHSVDRRLLEVEDALDDI